MSALHDPDEGLGGRVLLAIMGFGLVGLGLLAAAMMTLDEDAGRYDGLYGLSIAGVGAVAIIAATVGRAFGRWVLAGVGLLLVAQAAEIGLETVTYREAPDRFTVAVLAVLMIVGVSAIGVAVQQMVAHRERVRTLGPGQEQVCAAARTNQASGRRHERTLRPCPRAACRQPSSHPPLRLRWIGLG